MADLDPYRPPAESLEAPRGGEVLSGVCPKCGGQSAKRVGYTWWGGALGPKLFHVVKCTRCKAQYNGRTGAKLTGVIIGYQGVVLLVLVLAWYFFYRKG